MILQFQFSKATMRDVVLIEHIWRTRSMNHGFEGIRRMSRSPLCSSGKNVETITDKNQ